MSIELFMPYVTTHCEVLQSLWVGATQGWGRSFATAAAKGQKHGLAVSHYHERYRGGSKEWFSTKKRAVQGVLGFLKLMEGDRNGTAFFSKLRGMPVPQLFTGGMRADDDGISKQTLSPLDQTMKMMYGPQHAADCAAFLNVEFRSLSTVPVAMAIMRLGGNFLKDQIRQSDLAKDIIKWSVGRSNFRENCTFLSKIREAPPCDYPGVASETASAHCNKHVKTLQETLVKYENCKNEEIGLSSGQLSSKLQGFKCTPGWLSAISPTFPKNISCISLNKKKQPSF